MQMLIFPLETQTLLNTLMLPVLGLIGLLFAVNIDPYIKKPVRHILILIDLIVLSLILSNIIGKYWKISWNPDRYFLQTALAVYSYIMRPVIIVLFMYIVTDNPKRRLLWIPVVLNAVLYLTAFFRPWTFSISRNTGLFSRGPLGYSAYVVSFTLLIVLLAFAIIRYRQLEGIQRLIPVANVVIAGIGALMDAHSSDSGIITFTETATVFCSVFFYTWLHLQFVREHEQALVDEQRIRIMISQIQPHFLYNTLTTIQTLCLENPRKAAFITEKFAAYLRQNIDSLNSARLIPFRKELDHTLVYAQIEMERFPGIHLDYEIEDENFSLPALTVQPLVENAIRHGVRGRDRGQIDIITRRTADCHEIVIRDNGKGFEPDTPASPNSSHIGIPNVRERLKNLCGGTMNIESGKDKGTCITIRIPLGKESV